MPWEKFWRWYDRGARLEFGGTLLDFIFDWKAWISPLIGGAGGIVTFLWAAIEERSPLDVWIVAVVVAAALAVVVWIGILIAEKYYNRAIRPAAAVAVSTNLMSDYQEGKWEPIYPPSKIPVPGWPIRELFAHIRSDLPLTSVKRTGSATIDDLDERWKPVGNDVIKQLSLGHLHATGRKEAYGPLRHLAPAPIPSEFWQSAKFTYYFLDPDGKDMDHVVNDDGIRYSDLEVNRAEALAIWPLEPWPDFKKWDQKDELEFYEAACLWFNIEPRLPMPAQVQSKYQEWKAMVLGGGLPVHAPQVGPKISSENPESVTPHATIYRDVLKVLADNDRIQPLFLFPHRRGE